MPYHDTTHYQFFSWATSIGLAVAGGFLSAMLAAQEGKKFGPLGFCIYVAVSGFTGVLVILLADAFNQPETLAGALSGVAGFLSTRAWKLFLLWINRRYGLNLEDKKESKNE